MNILKVEKIDFFLKDSFISDFRKEELLNLKEYAEEIEKLNLALKDAIEHADDFANDCRRLEDQHRWRDCQKEDAPYNNTVLLYNEPNGNVYTGGFAVSIGYYLCDDKMDNNLDIEIDITHWKPIQTPPKENK